MADETLNVILSFIALVGVFGNIIAFLVTRLELRGQRKETKELAKLTSELEHKVHLLATHLDQRIYRLNRIRDLITGLIHTSVALRQGNRPIEDKLDISVKRAMTLPELAALIRVVNDKQLTQLFSEIEIVQTDPIWPNMWNAMQYDFEIADKLIQRQSIVTQNMHHRILELLEEVTQV